MKKIIVDSSVWINFFKKHPDTKLLNSLLLEDWVILHDWIYLELSVGEYGKLRNQILSDLKLLPRLPSAEWEDLLAFIDKEKLFGKGLSFVDVELLFSSINKNCLLWTQDKTLKTFAMKYKVHFAADKNYFNLH